MFSQLASNILVHLKFYRRNRLLLGIAILFLAFTALYLGGSLLFSTTTGRYDLTRELFQQLSIYALLFVAAVGLVLVTVQVRGREVKLILTKPCPPSVWLASAFLSAIALAVILYSGIVLLAYVLSLVWHFPFQGGFVYLAATHCCAAITAMSCLTFLAMITHPVVAPLILLLLSEDIFYSIRLGLIAAIKNNGGNVALPLLEKVTYVIYMLLPMFTPFDQKNTEIEKAFRVAPHEWQYLAGSVGYTAAVTLLFFLLTLFALQRKELV